MEARPTKIGATEYRLF
ncbi:uncharacterized protein FRV6_08567 [Fusarium oxysporum]|uniref:Uncharacterized protein n=1 Tax=Fusarium oxysporum TaxID=5507 RepID=A0A2H3TI95_FUSOX|nr:uncharacterized protein FRV6_08567 [Fusarium oxysporum]